MQQNLDLKQVYILLLNYMKERSEQNPKIMPIEAEIKFVESIKLFCESGWIIEEEDFYDVLDTLQTIEEYE